MSNEVPTFNLPGIGAPMGGQMGGSSQSSSSGSSTPPISLAAPDDRYYPGFTKDGKTYGPRLIETRVMFSLYGVTIPRSFGQRRLGGNMIWSDEIKERRVVSGNVITYEYYATFAVSYGYPDEEVTERDVLRAWADGRLMVDNRATSRQLATGFYYRFYKGTETQTADPVYELVEGAGNVPAYRGQMYIVVVDLPLKNFNNKIPEISIEIGDASEVTQSVTTMNATGDLLNNGEVIVNWNTRRAWVRNATFSTASIFAYDLEAGAFDRDVAVNQHVPGDKGIFERYGYIPWRNLMCAVPYISATNPLMYICDPDIGVPINTVTVRQPLRLYATRCQTALGEYTYIINFSGFGEIEIIQLDPEGELQVVGTLNTTWDAPTNGCLGPSDENVCTFYFGADDTPNKASVHKITIKPGLIAAGDATNGIVYTSNAIPYDGIADTYVANVQYSGSENCLFIFYFNGECRKYDFNAGANAWRIDDLPSAPASGSFWLSDISAGFIAFLHTDASIVEVDTRFGTWTPFDNTPSIIGHGDEVSDSRSRSVIGISLTTSKLSQVHYSTLADTRITLGYLITRLAVLAGYDEANIDIDAGVVDEVDGAILDQYQTLSEIIEPIKTIYGYEIIESGTTVKVTNKAASYVTPDFTFDSTKLVITNRGEDAFKIRREEEGLHPQQVGVTYINKSIAYHWDTQVASRNRNSTFDPSQSNTSTSFKISLIMTADEAKYSAYRVLWNPWIGRESFAFRLPPEYLTAEPADILSVTVKGYTHLIKVIDTTLNADYSVDVVGQYFQKFEDFPMSAFAGTSYTQVVPQQSGARIVAFECPAIADADDISSLNPTHPPGSIYYVMLPDRRTEIFEGQAFMAVGTGVYKPLKKSTFAVPAGRILTDVNRPNSPFAIDTVNSINVAIDAGDASLLASVSDADFLLGANMALIGQPGRPGATNNDFGRWEIIHFRDVVEEADGTFTFSHLLRGRKGTDWILTTLSGGRDPYAGLSTNTFINVNAQGKIRGGQPATLVGGVQVDTSEVVHTAGDMFILLDNDWLFNVRTEPANIGAYHRFKAIAAGQALTNVKPYNLVYHADSLAPLAVQDIHCDRDLNGTLTLTWNRRHRLTSELHDDDGDTPITQFEENKYLVILYRLAGDLTTYELAGGVYQIPDDGADRNDDYVQAGLFKLVSGQTCSFTYTEIYEAMINSEMNGVSEIVYDRQRFAGSHTDAGALSALTNVGPTFYKEYMSFGKVLVCVRQLSTLQDVFSQPDILKTIPDGTGIEYQSQDTSGTTALLTEAQRITLMTDVNHLRFGPYNVKYVDVRDV